MLLSCGFLLFAFVIPTLFIIGIGMSLKEFRRVACLSEWMPMLLKFYAQVVSGHG